MKIKTSGKVIIIGIVTIGLFCGKVFWWDKNHPKIETTNDIEIEKPNYDTLIVGQKIDSVIKTPVEKPTKIVSNEVKTEKKVIKPKKEKVKKQTKIKISEEENKSNNVIPNF